MSGSAPDSPSTEPRPLLLRAGAWIIGNAGVALVGGVVALLLAWATGVVGGDQKSPSRQLDSALQDAAKKNLSVVYNREVDLRGTGTKARIIILRPKNWVRRSDELRVYEMDDEGKDLKLAATIRPATRKREVAHRLEFVAAGRFGHGDAQQAIVNLSPSYVDTRMPRPIALEWNPRVGRYSARAVLKRPVSLPPARSRFARRGHQMYQPLDVRLAGGKTILNVGGAEAVKVQRGSVAAAYIVQQLCRACSGTWEIKVWQLDFSQPEYAGYECTAFSTTGKPKRLFTHPRTPVDVDRALSRALRRGSCPT